MVNTIKNGFRLLTNNIRKSFAIFFFLVFGNPNNQLLTYGLVSGIRIMEYEIIFSKYSNLKELILNGVGEQCKRMVVIIKTILG